MKPEPKEMSAERLRDLLALLANNSDAELPKIWVKEIAAHISHLEQRLAEWTQWGIVEVAVRNPQVADYCKHWEGRAETAEAHISHLEQELSEMEKLAELNRADYQEEFRERRAAEQESARLREALAYMIFWNETKHHHDLTGKRECPVCKAEAALAAPVPSPRVVPDTEEVKAAREWADRNLEIGELYNADYLARYALERARQARQEALKEAAQIARKGKDFDMEVGEGIAAAIEARAKESE